MRLTYHNPGRPHHRLRVSDLRTDPGPAHVTHGESFEVADKLGRELHRSHPALRASDATPKPRRRARPAG